MFRRRGSAPPDETQLASAADVDDAPTGQPAGGTAETAGTAAGGSGPFDAEQLPPDDTQPRVDLGALLVPIIDGVEVRVDVDQGAGSVIAVTLASATAAMQVAAFAAPRSEGIWEEVRAEIREQVQTAGGSLHEATGPFGPELRGQVPTDIPGQHATARFLGVDGPRWFLRALAQGSTAEAADDNDVLLAAFRALVVVRGTEAMAVRDPLPLRLPRELTADGGPLPAGAPLGSADGGAATGDTEAPPGAGPGTRAGQAAGAPPADGAADGAADGTPGTAPGTVPGTPADPAVGAPTPAAAPAGTAEPNPYRDTDLDPFTRGPEITEVR